MWAVKKTDVYIHEISVSCFKDSYFVLSPCKLEIHFHLCHHCTVITVEQLCGVDSLVSIVMLCRGVESETPGELVVILTRFKYASTSLHYLVFTLQQVAP